MSLLPKVPGLKLKNTAMDAEAVEFTITSTSLPVACPVCGQQTARLHSHYGRTVADLPWSGRRVRLLLNVRKFRCSGMGCPRRIFTERLPDLVESYARKTVRLHEILELVGFAPNSATNSGSVAFLVNKPYRGAPSSRVRRRAAMRTVVAAHQLLPERLSLESLSIESGRVSISVSSGTRRSRCSLCGRGSCRVHSRYSRTVSDLPPTGPYSWTSSAARSLTCFRSALRRASWPG